MQCLMASMQHTSWYQMTVELGECNCWIHQISTLFMGRTTVQAAGGWAAWAATGGRSASAFPLPEVPPPAAAAQRDMLRRQVSPLHFLQVHALRSYCCPLNTNDCTTDGVISDVRLPAATPQRGWAWSRLRVAPWAAAGQQRRSAVACRHGSRRRPWCCSLQVRPAFGLWTSQASLERTQVCL